MVGAQHSDTRSKLGSSERDHVLSNMGSNHLTMLRRSVVKNPLNKVISVLVAGNVNQRNAGAVAASLANSIKISTEKLGTTNLEALLHNLGGKLVSAILCSISDDVVDGPAAVRGGSVFAYVLDAPVPKLAVSHNIDIGENFFDAGALNEHVLARYDNLSGKSESHPPCPLRGSSRKCSVQRDCQSLQGQPHATFP